jgi:hypothetical protein
MLSSLAAKLRLFFRKFGGRIFFSHLAKLRLGLPHLQLRDSWSWSWSLKDKIVSFIFIFSLKHKRNT